MDRTLTGQALAGRFQVGARIHLGGTVEVYEAKDLRGDVDVAVKVLARFVASDPGLRARLAVEAQAAGVLQHPNVVRVIDYGEEPDGVAFIVMERLHGRTLRQAIDADGPFAVETASRIVREVLSALGAAHGMGIRHRDLKPSNVFLSDEAGGPRTKLMDFGVAKIEGMIRQTFAGTVGTPRYFPPERIRAPGTEDHRGDVHAAGVLLYEMLTGRHPFGTEEAEDQMRLLMTAEAPEVRALRPDVPEPVARAIAKALAREPAERFASAAEMSKALRTEAD